MQTKTTTERTLFDEPAPEVEVVEDQQLAPAAQAVAPAQSADDEPAMMALARMSEGVQIMERAHQILVSIRRQAIKLTGPRDWVAMKGKGAPDEAATCMLTNSGACRIAPFFGIHCGAGQPTGAQGEFEPKIERGEDGEVQYTAWCEATCRLTGETMRITARRSSTEDFIGRWAIAGTSQLVARGDLAESVASTLQTKAVRKLAGMGNVPIQELADAGIKIEHVTRGSGFGSASDRGASAVASEDVKAARKKLGDEIMSRVGGDQDAAAKLLRDVTANSPKFMGFDSIARLTKDWQVENAWSKLRSHEVFGDAEVDP